ncbi:Satratoxin biosynthesis SC1 cluster protein 4 [Lachnellula cervina]|uniref:Satratoxin biosynthesis SC1 cluster protein 4 n=1 Tax=Lachnellula cervina TaxID=1316786 RepID=A0A7D8ULI0_9HELO|nr:Satratoxin biosynthesis SC1 cluster protein 4 [Lachnellula cervina]
MATVDGVTTVIPAPEGYVVNFQHPYQTGATTGYWLCGVGTFLALSSLLIRLYTRHYITRSAAAEECRFARVSFGVVVQALVLRTWAIKATGVHAWEIPVERFNQNSLLQMLQSVFYVPTLAGAKLSILFLYRRLSPDKWFRKCVYFMMGVIMCYSIAILFSVIFPCKPISANWDVTITDGKCADKTKIYLATAGLNVITDILILALPIPMVWNLQMPRRRRIGLVGLFALGSATCVTSIIRLIYLIPMLSNVDSTYAVALPLIWVEVEVNLVIIVCCLPALQYFLRRFAPRLIGERSNQRTTETNPALTPGGHGNTIGQITSRKVRRNKGGYMMTEDNIELTGVEGHSSPGDAATDHDSEKGEKGIWTSKTFTVQVQ